MFDRILVALDGSAFAEQSLPLAEALATRFEASLTLVSVHEPVIGVEMEGWDQSAAEWAEEYIGKVAAKVAQRSGLSVESRLVHGTPVRAILNQARKSGADLIVAATHGRGLLSRAWLGSVADGLLRHSERPLLLVRPEKEDEGEDEAAAPPLWSRILVPLDGSDFSCGILDDAVALARGHDAAVHLVRVVPVPMEIASPYLPTTIQMNRQVLESAKSSAEEWLDAKADEMRARGIEVTTRVKVAAQPAGAICEAAVETDADVIVMATHGRSGIGRAVLGSTADKVLRSTHLPVLVHRPADSEEE